MRVIVDSRKCITAGQCMVTAPEVFDLGDDGVVTLLEDSPPAHLHEAVRDSADLCPARVIRVED